MLSIVDLVEAETLSVALASRLATRILDGSSFLVGARPGGAGKTTVMGALLGVLPSGTGIALATELTPGVTDTIDCVVAYELSPGFYDGYIWGEELLSFTALRRQGKRIVANLHADTASEIYDLIVGQNGGNDEDVTAFDLFIPIAMRRNRNGISRIVEDVYDLKMRNPIEASEKGTQDRGEVDRIEHQTVKWIEHCLERGIKHIEAVRESWISFTETL